MPRAVALFSGGLDSTLAILLVQRQGIEVQALNIRTTFDCCRAPAAQLAHQLGAKLTVLSVAEDYIDVLRNPTHGYGRGVNPCVDCRIYMAKMAKRFMEDMDACLVITGEVVGQRPMSQKKRDLSIIEEQSGLQGRLLRPLSAKLLPPTLPEKQGIIDRSRLKAFSGRNRTSLMRLAQELGLKQTPQPSTGCALTEVTFAPRVRDLWDHNVNASLRDLELLKLGRHIRVDTQIKAVVGRDATENAALALFFEQEASCHMAYLHPENFLGADVLVTGRIDEQSIELATGLVLRHSKNHDSSIAKIRVTHRNKTRSITAQRLPEDRLFRPL
jgi:hypothetical protein